MLKIAKTIAIKKAAITSIITTTVVTTTATTTRRRRRPQCLKKQLRAPGGGRALRGLATSFPVDFTLSGGAGGYGHSDCLGIGVRVDVCPLLRSSPQ